jgi:hypothetical protein
MYYPYSGPSPHTGGASKIINFLVVGGRGEGSQHRGINPIVQLFWAQFLPRSGPF